MRVDNIDVRWQYESVQVQEKKTKIFYDTELTVCIISSKTDETEVEISRGVATCSIFDKFDKEVGRRLSMTRALTSFMFPANMRKTESGRELAVNQRKFRARFWEAYRTMGKKPKWSKNKNKSKRSRATT